MGRFGGVTVDGAGRGVHQSGDACPPGSFQHRERSFHVHPGGGRGVQLGARDRSQRRQVRHPGDAGEGLANRGRIPDVSFADLDQGVPGDAVAPAGGEVIENPDPLPRRGALQSQGGADEAGAAGD